MYARPSNSDPLTDVPAADAAGLNVESSSLVVEQQATHCRVDHGGEVAQGIFRPTCERNGTSARYDATSKKIKVYQLATSMNSR